MGALALLSWLKEQVEQGSQFVIATHSPILMAIPGATIYSFDDGAVNEVDFDDLESVNLVRDFLQAPERYLRMIWENDT